MTRAQLVGMSSALFLLEVIMALSAIQDVARGQYEWWGDAIILGACVISVGFTGFLVWFAYDRKSNKRPSEIPEASAYIQDPFFDWCKDNEALIRQYHGCHLAISPSQGIVAVARSDREFERMLQTIELPDDAVLTHASILLDAKPYTFLVH